MHFGTRLAMDGPGRSQSIETSKNLTFDGARSAAGCAGSEERKETGQMFELPIDLEEWFDQNIESRSRIASGPSPRYGPSVIAYRSTPWRCNSARSGGDLPSETGGGRGGTAGAGRRPGHRRDLRHRDQSGPYPMTSRYHFSAELVRYFEERRQGALGREPNAWVA